MKPDFVLLCSFFYTEWEFYLYAAISILLNKIQIIIFDITFRIFSQFTMQQLKNYFTRKGLNKNLKNKNFFVKCSKYQMVFVKVVLNNK